MIKKMNGLVETIVTEIRQKMDRAIIPMSGGIDSSVCACLCQMALGKDKVHSLHLPYGSLDEETFNHLSKDIAKKLGISIAEYSIRGATDNVIAGVEDMVAKSMGFKGIPGLRQVNTGNHRARMRMATTYLFNAEMGFRHGDRARVIGTGNKSEAFIHYYTKGGDGVSDFNPILDLYKAEVFELAAFFVERGLLDPYMIKVTPSAGLWDKQTDEDEIGYPYDEIEKSIRKIISYDCKGDWDYAGCDERVWSLHQQGKHKTEVHEIKLRKFCD